MGYLGVANEIKIQMAGQSGVSWQVVHMKGRKALPLTAVGVGVSQILPILVMGLLAPNDTLLLVEQPELHLHPSVQARLGDFFMGLAQCEKQCLIETHSENLVSQLRYHTTQAGGQEKSDSLIYKEITISVVILEALPDFARPSDNSITQKFPLLITPDDLQPLINAFDLWSKSEQGITYVIIKQFEKSWSSNNINPLKFRLGPHFVDSVNNRGLDNNEIVLRSIIRAASDVIANKARDIPGYRLHHFRKSETADSPQLIRDVDQAKAWRLMVSKRGAGWRLHYWQIPTSEGSVIEFANVCKESEREIF